MRKPCPYIDPDVREGVAEALAHTFGQHDRFTNDRNAGRSHSSSFYGRYLADAPEFIGWLKLAGCVVSKRI